jgi:DegV family protein with EDD domain
VVDSTASLPEEIAAQNAIHVVPMKLSFAGQPLRDGVDIAPEEFYRRLASGGPMPKTASPSPGDFLQAFQRASAEGAAGVLCLTLASELSGAYQAAQLGAEQAQAGLPRLRIRVVDTRTAGGAQGLVALGAAREAATGTELDHVEAVAQGLISRVQFLGVLDTLYYLWKGGRVPRAAVWATSLLQIKPVLEIRDGRVSLLERPRTRRRATQRVLDVVAQRAGHQPIRALVMHADLPQEAADVLARLTVTTRCEEAHIVPFTPVIGAHTGPGLLAIAFHTL